MRFQKNSLLSMFVNIELSFSNKTLLGNRRSKGPEISEKMVVE